MRLDMHEYLSIDEFTLEFANDISLISSMERALNWYRDYNDTTQYAVILDINGYYGITKQLNEFTPNEFSPLVQPFDEIKVYPLQRIRKVITWD